MPNPNRDYPQLAETVVIKGKPKFQFDVDGEEFPWWITSAGPKVMKLDEDLFAIKVTLFCNGTSPDDRHQPNMDGPAVIIDTHENPSFGNRKGEMQRFPWAITQTGVRTVRSALYCTQATLAFFAKAVDCDSSLILDMSPRVQEVRDLDGSYQMRNDVRVGEGHVDVKVNRGVVPPPV